MLTLNDGRAELWQWDTGRTLAVDADCSQVHFSNKVLGRSIDVDVIDGTAIIPDVLLQTDKDLNVWAFVGTAENGYTKISKTFNVNRRNKPADYVFTPTEQMTLQMIQRQIGDLADLTTEAKDTLVAAINEAARTGGGAGSMDLRVADGYIQYSRDGGMTWTNLIAMADLKGADGKSAYQYAVEAGYTGTEAEFSARMAAEIPTVDSTLTQSGQAADAAEVGNRLSALSEEIANLQTSGLTTAQVNALDGMLKVCAFTKADVSAEYTAFKTAFGIADSGGETEVTLSSITASYSGGDVPVGTAVTALTGIVVTAHYSDGTSKTVTGYTLSGTIAEGSNTVTVTYQGKTATFTVTGVAESGGGDIVATWESGVPYVKNVVDNEYVEKDGTIKTYNGWSRTDYLNCYGASKIVYSGGTYPSGYNAFYDEDKKFISNFEALAVPSDSEVVVPDNAVYVVFSSLTSSLPGMVITPYA